MKRISVAALVALLATPAHAHHPVFSWAVIGDHALEWEHLLFLAVMLAGATIAYRARRRKLARVAAKPERPHDPR